MSLQVEKLEKNTAKLTIEVPAEKFDAAVKNAYNKSKSRFNIPGFRKGKAPFEMIKKMYGAGVFFEDAANEVIDESYPDAAKESGLVIVSRPTVDVTQIEEGKDFIYTAVVAVKPEVTLGQYKGVEVQKVKADVTDADIDAEISSVRNKNSRLVTVEDRAVENGDLVTIDFDGYVDGKRFDGGKGDDYPLTIGSHTFIDTFEEQLIGKNIGEECDVNVTFPAEYHVEDLKNKPAVFKVKVKEIQKRELPEVNDEFASEVSDFDTLEEYKADIKKNLEEKKADAAKRAKEDAAVDAAVANATMEIPDAMLDTQVNQMIDDFARRMQSQGLTMDQYLQFTGTTLASLQEQMKPQALKRIQTRLVLEKIAEAEAIEIADEKIDEEIAKMAEMYKMEADKLKEMLGDAEKEQMKKDMAVQEAVTILAEAAKEVEKTEE